MPPVAKQPEDSPRSKKPSAFGVDTATLMRVKNLQLRAKIVVEGLLSGLHRSPYHGISVEFSEYREYSPGDDPRHLDWRLFARSDRYYVKRFEDETNLRCHLLIDCSRSMDYGSLSYNKFEYAKTLLATLAYFLVQQRDAVGLLAFDEQVRCSIGARFRPGHLHRLILALDEQKSGSRTQISPPIEQVLERVTKRGLVVLVSDLLVPVEPLEEQFSLLVSRGHEVVVVRVLDPAERAFTFEDSSMFVDAESNQRVFVDPRSVRETYLKEFEDHDEQIRQACRSRGIDFIMADTNEPLDLILFRFLQQRALHHRVQRRRRPAAPRTAGGTP